MSYETALTKAQQQKSINDAVNILRNNLPIFTEKFQSSNSVNGFYEATENVEWTTGFCTGEYWLAYELTNDNSFKEAAEKQVESFLHRIENEIDVNHHDMGFLYIPSCVAAYKLTKSETAKKAALLAADHLCKRFHEKGKFLQAWGDLNAPDNYRLIIDCLLNVPLLYWASETTQNPKYSEIASLHIQTSLNNLVRADNSTYHTYFFNPETGQPLHGVTHQGYKNDSAWARGQAWGIYGTALAYKYEKNQQSKDLFEKITNFFMENLPEDSIPYWDLCFGRQSDEPKDSSAAAIAICGILEMLPHLQSEQAEKYAALADKMLLSLANDYSVKSPQQSNGLLLHGVYAKNSPYNPIPSNRGVDECNTWGDYFYLEALARKAINWTPYW